jgi:hypothetical protein
MRPKEVPAPEESKWNRVHEYCNLIFPDSLQVKVLPSLCSTDTPALPLIGPHAVTSQPRAHVAHTMVDPAVSSHPRRLVVSAIVSEALALSFAALRLSIRSASVAAASASGISGIVSKEEILGLRERRLVGVDGTEDADEVEYPGNASLYLAPSDTGEDCAGTGVVVYVLLVLSAPGNRGEEGRRRAARGKV